MSVIRLKSVIKDLNISLHRAVEFLGEKGITIDENPNSKIEQNVHDVLVAEFQSDQKQKVASTGVVINKIPEKPKPEPKIEEPRKEEFLRVKATLEGPKTLGKIDLSPKKIEPKLEVEKPAEIEKIHIKEEPKVENISLIEKNTFKVLDKIELPVKKEFKKPEIQKELKEEKPQIKEEIVIETKIETIAENTTTDVEIDHHKTKYQILDGPKITGDKIDLTQFDKKKPAIKPKPTNTPHQKRKRIETPSTTKPGGTTGTGTGTGTGYQGNNQNRTGGGGGYQGGNNQNRTTHSPNYKGNRGTPFTPQVELTDEQVKNQIKETLEKLTSRGTKSSKGAKHRRDKRIVRREFEQEQDELSALDRTIKVTEFITVNELASLMDVTPTEVISACFSLGVMVTMNQRLEADTLTLVADEFGFQVEFADAEVEESAAEDADNEEDLLPRAPIVTVMGHVDHGKTSLLDYVRKANVIAGESGGITQHIGAYNVKLPDGQRITFLDTPGHEAFTAMRARGAQVTDLAIIVVAADDDVMPQTKEAISHAQAAGVPMIIAINKVDKETANPDKIREQLSAMNILVEDWGGNVQCQEISAKFGNNVELLLEKVLLEAEMLKLTANPNKIASGVVIEASLDKGRGYVSTILVQSGTLKIGDYMVAGKNHGKVKSLLDERGNIIREAGPSVPVTVLGLDGAPTAGDKFRVFTDESEGKQLASKREQLHREQALRTHKHITLDVIGRRIALGNFKELNIILKGDVDGSVEALTDSLQKLSTEEIAIKILHKGVGQITESDVLLASASDAIVIGFNVRPGASAKDIAQKEEIEIRNYSIIYDVINDVKEAMEGMLSPEIKEEITGNVEIREIFKISKVGTIAGCMVTDGKIFRNSKIRLLRDNIVVFDGVLESLKRFKDDVKEVAKGYDCGLNLKGFNDIEIGDILEAYQEVQVKKKLK